MQRHHSRARLGGFAVGIVALAVASGCSETAHRTASPPSAPTASAPTAPSTSSTVAVESCTLADLTTRGAVPVPTPEFATRHIDFKSGSFSRIDPPAAGVQPKISAAKAWQLAQDFWSPASPRGTYRIVFGYVWSSTVRNRLAWLIIGHHIPSRPLSGGPGPVAGVTRPPEPPCHFTDTLQPVDATTGQTLFIETGDLIEP
jgi:hypothetical protein